MKIEEAVNNQSEVVKLLKNSYEHNLLSHAYLFDGEAGSGKYEIAIYMASMMLCESTNKPCNKCHNCLRVQNNNHLNVTCVEAEGEIIKKEQIDSFIHELMMTGLEKGPQIGIIKDADKMNSSATNALLKVLEEPAPNHYIFLLTTNSGKILDTIISRTQVIRFKPLPRKYIMNTLQDNGVERDMAYVLSYVTNDLERSKKLIEEGKIYNILMLAKEIEKNIAKNKEPLATFIKNNDCLKNESDKMYHRFFIDILILIKRELLNKYNSIENEYFNDITSLYEKEELNCEKIIYQLDVLCKYQIRLNYYVNLNLFYTSLMVEISK